jgi:formiminotetrahydrofolate cyclodeaminase
MVAGSFCGSVVASRNFTCGGGSSSVFSSALKLLLENMCTSSMRYTL